MEEGEGHNFKIKKIKVTKVKVDAVTLKHLIKSNL